jgi:hypothetical protein
MVRKKTIHRIVVVLGAVVVILLAEWSVRSAHLYDRSKWRLPSESQGLVLFDGSPVSKTKSHILVRELAPKKDNRAFRPPTAQPRLFPVSVEPIPFLNHPSLGMVLKPNSRYRTIQKDGDRIVFDRSNTIDEFGRRWTPHSSEQLRNRSLLTFGTSEIFGFGLEDDQTMAAALVRAQKTYRVYNYAFDTYAPGSFLREVRAPGFGEDIAIGRRGYALYFFNQQHLDRMIGGLGIYRTQSIWSRMLPYFWLESDGSLHDKGMQAERGLLSGFYKIVAKSDLLGLTRVRIPLGFSNGDFELFSAIISEMKRILSEKFNGMELIVVVNKAQTEAVKNALIRALDKREVRSIDYSGLDWSRHVEGPSSLENDVHPSKELNDYLARQIANDLDLNRPDVE